jgi:hypothetical protein
MSRSEDRNPDDRDQLFYQEGRQGFQGSLSDGRRTHGHPSGSAFDLVPSDVRRFWLHQANLAMNQLIGRKLLGHDASARRRTGHPQRVCQYRLGRLDHRLSPPPCRLQAVATPVSSVRLVLATRLAALCCVASEGDCRVT